MIGQKRYAAVILAGGQNTRFGGTNKALVRVFGEKMIERIIRELRKIFKEIILVTNSPEVFSDLPGVKVISDVIKNAGPLGGLHAAIQTIDCDSLFLVSCDMPFIQHDFINSQIQVYENSGKRILIPEINGFPEPMHSLISSEINFELNEFLGKSENRKLIDFLKQQDPAFWIPDRKEQSHPLFININSYEELEKYGLYGIVAVLGFGQNAPSKNIRIAGELGELLAKSGWGVAVGNSEGTFREVSLAAIREGGFAKIIFSREDITGDAGNWPVKVQFPDVKTKRKRIVETSDYAIVIGGGEGTAQLIHEFSKMNKMVIIHSNTGGIAKQSIPNAIYIEHTREAIEWIKKNS